MATTTNYSWTTPDDTDLVKDGAAAIRTLGSSADTTVKNLNPGTTAGDIDYYTSSTAKARIAIGTAGQVLTVNSGATAPEWAAPATPASGLTLITSQAFSAASTINVNDVFSATYDNYLVLLTGTMTASTNVNLRFRVGGADDSTSNYNIQYNDMTSTTDNVDSQTAQNISRIANASANQHFSSQTIFYRPFAAEKKFFDAIVTRATTGASIGMGRNLTGFDAATSFTGFSLLPGSGTITGTVKVYGYQN